MRTGLEPTRRRSVLPCRQPKLSPDPISWEVGSGSKWTQPQHIGRRSCSLGPCLRDVPHDGGWVAAAARKQPLRGKLWWHIACCMALFFYSPG
jgi:hypothetical protein